MMRGFHEVKHGVKSEFYIFNSLACLLSTEWCHWNMAEQALTGTLTQLAIGKLHSEVLLWPASYSSFHFMVWPVKSFLA